ncbi:hypothetical protein TRFO_37250 [Tritrichomonas foetus]|uniref:Protein kinase domain-containing protein n=1 Tax=Tritrichomonas foetus TaxID=1144522 RepID=A0A1J4JG06_9EUKA|nr:hypothetical protein TRFO_37250 [Tritrichomonas foetus]|eukprot:OHS96571.1 hypothetical protein TRFO_37250 [Tritrichomonas foetus]
MENTTNDGSPQEIDKDFQTVLEKKNFVYLYQLTENDAYHVVASNKYQMNFVCKRVSKSNSTSQGIYGEINALKMLNSQDIIKMYDFEITRNFVYIFFEFCPNGSLQDYIEKYGQLEGDTLVGVAKRLLFAVQYMHSKSCAHLNIRPSNILIDDYGRIKLSNFYNVQIFNINSFHQSVTCLPQSESPNPNNLQNHNNCYNNNILPNNNNTIQIENNFDAMNIKEEKKSPILQKQSYFQRRDANLRLNDTKDNLLFDQSAKKEGSKNLMKSILYKSPEILNNQTFDPFSADIWSLGVTFYYMATKRYPFLITKNFKDTHDLIRSGKVHFDSFPNKKFLSLIKQMLIIDPNSRPNASTLLNLPLFENVTRIDGKLLKVSRALSNDSGANSRRSMNVKSLIMNTKTPLNIPEPVNDVFTIDDDYQPPNAASNSNQVKNANNKINSTMIIPMNGAAIGQGVYLTSDENWNGSTELNSTKFVDGHKDKNEDKTEAVPRMNLYGNLMNDVDMNGCANVDCLEAERRLFPKNQSHARLSMCSQTIIGAMMFRDNRRRRKSALQVSAKLESFQKD